MKNADHYAGSRENSSLNQSKFKGMQENWARQEANWESKEEKWAAREEAWPARADSLADQPDKLARLEEQWDAIREKWDDQREHWNEKREEWDAIVDEFSHETSKISFNEDTNTYSVKVSVTAAEINALIVAADVGATILLLDGTHEFSETIQINRDDITFSGESESGTVLNFTFPEGTGGNGIKVTSGAEKTDFSELVDSVEAGTVEITIGDASSLSVGDVIYLRQANTEEYLIENGWDNVSFEDADQRPFREMIVRIEAIEGNTLTLASPLPYDFDAHETDIFQIDLLEGVALANFTVTSGITDTPNYNNFVNTQPEFYKTSVILIEGADGASLSGISVLDAPSNAFDFRSTIDLAGTNLYVNGAHNLGGGGNGYGFQLYETFDATLTALEVYNVRHSVIFSSWHAEAGNYIEISSTNRDVNFHGSPDQNNTVIVESSILEYNTDEHSGPGNGFWDIVSGGGSNHANGDFYEDNTVVFQYAEGSHGSETIYATDGGAYLDGNGSQDLLIGGDGNDILIGGASRDVLFGGEGADIFAFEVGDSFDTIIYFSGSDEGDLIWFTGEHDLLSFDDLAIYQDGEDTSITYGGSSRITLADYDMAQLDSGFFVFDGDPVASLLV